MCVFMYVLIDAMISDQQVYICYIYVYVYVYVYVCVYIYVYLCVY